MKAVPLGSNDYLALGVLVLDGSPPHKRYTVHVETLEGIHGTYLVEEKNLPEGAGGGDSILVRYHYTSRYAEPVKLEDVADALTMLGKKDA